MEVKDIRKTAEFSNEKMKKTNLFQTELVLCDVYGLEPGQNQNPHTHHDSDKIYMVISGKATVKIGGEEQTLGENQIVIAPSGQEHGISNPGPERLSVLVFMAPVHIHRH